LSLEEALEEWKRHDPYLLDFEGFQRFLEEKEKKAKLEEKKAKPQSWEEPQHIRRQKYCTQKLRNLVLRAVVSREFGDIERKPIGSWEEFCRMAERYSELKQKLGDWIPFDTIGMHKIREVLGIELEFKFAYQVWRSVVRHPEWFGDWDSALGAKGYSGDAYWLRMWLALCYVLGVGEEASEILNNIPEELREPEEVPDYIKSYLEEEGWKDTYKCRDCQAESCVDCVPYINSLRKHSVPCY